MDLTFGVTGAGKVGASFVKAFGAVGLRCAGIYGGAYADKKAKLLGVPLVRDMFHQNRWDYVYYMNPRFGDIERRRLTVYFDETGRLSRYEFNPLPNEISNWSISA